jgi:hydroxymethylbilane synthase
MVFPSLRIGTRSSPLALKQTHLFIEEVKKTFPSFIPEIVPMTTTGDKIKDRPLAEIGGKGLFAKELETALHENRIDCAVHSLKDLPHTFSPELVLAAVLPREAPWDVLITDQADSLQTLAPGKVIGTCSPRRQAQLHQARPDLKVTMMRGNVQTRLDKLARGEVDALIMAEAGLRRLQLEDHITERFALSLMVPAVGQGVIAIQTRADDTVLNHHLSKITHAETALAITAERAMLQIVQGDCYTPLAGYATVDTDQSITLIGMLAHKGQCHRVQSSGYDPMVVGQFVGEKLRQVMLS